MKWQQNLNAKINSLMIDYVLDFKLAQNNYKRLNYIDKGYITSKIRLLDDSEITIDIEFIPFLGDDKLFSYIVENQLEFKFISEVKSLFDKRRKEGYFIEYKSK